MYAFPLIKYMIIKYHLNINFAFWTKFKCYIELIELV